MPWKAILIGISLIIISTEILFFSCKREEPVIATDLKTAVSPMGIINDFYKEKSQYLNCYHKNSQAEHIRKMQKAWEKIMHNRDTILYFLLEKTTSNDFSIDSTFSLYGLHYEENPYTIERIPNYMHALYLTEAIICNDYLFNRRHFNQGWDLRTFFENDGLNFIYKRDSIPKLLDVSDSISTKIKNSYIDKAWHVYRSWYSREYFFTKQLGGNSPIYRSKYKWYSVSQIRAGRTLTPLMIYTKDELMSKIYHLEFKIGNGWKPSEPVF